MYDYPSRTLTAARAADANHDRPAPQTSVAAFASPHALGTPLILMSTAKKSIHPECRSNCSTFYYFLSNTTATVTCLCFHAFMHNCDGSGASMLPERLSPFFSKPSSQASERMAKGYKKQLITYAHVVTSDYVFLVSPGKQLRLRLSAQYVTAALSKSNLCIQTF